MEQDSFISVNLATVEPTGYLNNFLQLRLDEMSLGDNPYRFFLLSLVLAIDGTSSPYHSDPCICEI